MFRSKPLPPDLVPPQPSPEALAELAVLEGRINALLPPQYQYCFDSVSPTSMGSAKLKYGPDGRVAWDEIWSSYCDLALAGGPPHRGTLLEVPTPAEVEGDPANYQLVLGETIRGIRMTTGIVARPGSVPGWISVPCSGVTMAGWLLRAVMAENVFVRQAGTDLLMPVGPAFRLAKEVKNVVVSLAKTCHYWCEHLSKSEKDAVSQALATPDTLPLLAPASRPEVLARAEAHASATQDLTGALERATGGPIVPSQAPGWIGIRFTTERAAAWYVRAAIAENILARREEDTLFLPVPESTAGWEDLVARVDRLYRLRKAHCLLKRDCS